MFNVQCVSGLDLLVRKSDAKPNDGTYGKIISASDGLNKNTFSHNSGLSKTY